MNRTIKYYEIETYYDYKYKEHDPSINTIYYYLKY